MAGLIVSNFPRQAIGLCRCGATDPEQIALETNVESAPLKNKERGRSFTEIMRDFNEPLTEAPRRAIRGPAALADRASVL